MPYGGRKTSRNVKTSRCRMDKYGRQNVSSSNVKRLGAVWISMGLLWFL